ncbi:Alpha-L-rhamnosidase N-terminal domain-containing protein [Catalinimonas alkaloidigena]|uniref:alpha-L-rhamnosidase n=1 Tax=Catalinimonas alkaloidigena TaxID=1075417 RepID=A0A1G9QE75_9BACT|nr:family 78 glycoside hydrolase catalytic domain [Catalinimonas alkaloidigena]SDM09041.1 Alpha-L-rhamnosidase N-terminal domain-containing protein [Catalinimonas alkaloidigena]
MLRLFLPLLLVWNVVDAQAQTLQVQRLRCEYKENPLGIDTPKPRLSWELTSTVRGVKQQACRIIVASSPEALARNMGDIWDTGKQFIKTPIQVQVDGVPLQPASTYYWKVKVWDNASHVTDWSEPATWQMGLMQERDWQGAQWIGYEALPDSNRIVPAAHGKGKKAWGKGEVVLPLLRKEFAVSKPVEKATMFISGLGHFELSMNGQKVGDHFLDPGWTDYDEHALYVTFDVTEALQEGDNALGVMLGTGFYYIPRERYRKLTGAFGYPKMICRLQLEYADGSTESVISDPSWKTAPGPTTFSSIYSGEDYDATQEQPGWDTPGFDDAAWKHALTVDGPPRLEAQRADPLKIMERFEAKTLTEPTPGTWVYDFGQNMSGIPQLTVRGNRGDTIRMIPAELLTQEGLANQKATGSPSYFTYILKGDGEETWQPRFTYYGFRYMQVEGGVPQGNLKPDDRPVLVNVRALHTRNAAERVGEFTSSNELFNRTDQLIDWAIKSNMVSVFTDCPHREKLGWLEEAHLMGSSVRYNYDIANLCRKEIEDMKMAQTDAGLVPEIVPEYVQFEDPFRDSPEWGSSAVILPWYLYQWYGDERVLEESYPMMQQYVDYLATKAEGNILTHGLGDWYDLGPERPGFSQLTPMGVTATAMYYYDLTIMSQIAKRLKKETDATKYAQCAADVKQAFNRKFFHPKTGQYATGSQTANAIALYVGLVEPNNQPRVLNNLVRDIRKRNNALTAGDVGYRYVVQTLDAAGRSDVIFDMNSRDDVPGYGYQLAHGATALTESWQALPVVSNNHFMLGHLMEWFYEGLGGIRRDTSEVAFKKIVIRPEPVGDVTSARAQYRSPYGLIVSDWKKEGKRFTLHVEIPVSSTATVYLPTASKSATITEGGKPLSAYEEIELLSTENGKTRIAIGSGSYDFVVE